MSRKIESDLEVKGTATASNGTLSHVEGTNDGTNWTSLTIDDDTYDIPGGGSSTSVVVSNATASFVSDATYADYPYRAAIAVTGCTANSYPQVTFSDDQATSGNYAPFCESYAGGVYIYAKVSTTITVPTVSVGLDQPVEITIDATPTSGSSNAVSSGGVYTELAGKQASGDYATNTALTTGLAEKVSKSGDTMTGKLTLTNGYDWSTDSSLPMTIVQKEGTSSQTTYSNVIVATSDDKNICIFGGTQSSSSNGFRLGIRKRDDTGWGAFCTFSQSGELIVPSINTAGDNTDRVATTSWVNGNRRGIIYHGCNNSSSTFSNTSSWQGISMPSSLNNAYSLYNENSGSYVSVPYTGYYEVNGSFHGSCSTGFVSIGIYADNNSFVECGGYTYGGRANRSVSTIVRCSAGQNIQLRIYNVSGGTLTLDGYNEGASLSIIFLGY